MATLDRRSSPPTPGCSTASSAAGSDADRRRPRSSTSGRGLAALPMRPGPAERLTDLFLEARFSPHPIGPAERDEAHAALLTARRDLAVTATRDEVVPEGCRPHRGRGRRRGRRRPHPPSDDAAGRAARPRDAGRDRPRPAGGAPHAPGAPSPFDRTPAKPPEAVVPADLARLASDLERYRDPDRSRLATGTLDRTVRDVVRQRLLLHHGVTAGDDVLADPAARALLGPATAAVLGRRGAGDQRGGRARPAGRRAGAACDAPIHVTGGAPTATPRAPRSPTARSATWRRP